MSKEKFTKALALTLATENPDVILNVLKAAGITVDEGSSVMGTIHQMREVSKK